MEISLEQLGIEVVKKSPNFFRGMKQGDEKAVVLNDGVAVIYCVEKLINKRRIQMAISVVESVNINARLNDEDVAKI